MQGDPRLSREHQESNMDAHHDPISNRKFYELILGNEDTFQDDGSKNPLNVSKKTQTDESECHKDSSF